MRPFFITLIIFISFQSLAQVRKFIYVNEKYEEIDFNTFSRKVQSELFFVSEVENDTAVFKKIRFKEFYGDLTNRKKSQLNKLFLKKFNIDSTKIWFIHYQDSLPNIQLMPEKSGIIYLDSFKIRHRHVMSYEDDKKIIPRELKEYKKVKNLSLLHFYGINKGYPAITEEYKWFKDYNLILKKTFTDGMKMYRAIIIYPNGNFVVYAINKPPFEIKKLLNFKSFKKAEKKWRRKYEKYK